MTIDWTNPYERKKFEDKILLHQGRRLKWSHSEKFVWSFQIFFIPLIIMIALYSTCAYYIVTNAIAEKNFHETLMKKEWLEQNNEASKPYCV